MPLSSPRFTNTLTDVLTHRWGLLRSHFFCLIKNQPRVIIKPMCFLCPPLKQNSVFHPSEKALLQYTCGEMSVFVSNALRPVVGFAETCN